MTNVLDPRTFERFQQARETARKHGLALADVLNNSRLLLTPAREHEIQVGVLEDLLRRFDRQTASKLMAYEHGRTTGTPAEMFAAMRTWLEAVVRNHADGTLGDL